VGEDGRSEAWTLLTISIPLTSPSRSRRQATIPAAGHPHPRRHGRHQRTVLQLIGIEVEDFLTDGRPLAWREADQSHDSRVRLVLDDRELAEVLVEGEKDALLGVGAL